MAPAGAVKGEGEQAARSSGLPRSVFLRAQRVTRRILFPRRGDVCQARISPVGVQEPRRGCFETSEHKRVPLSRAVNVAGFTGP